VLPPREGLRSRKHGQNARSGGGVRPDSKAGQMRCDRRLARRGFSNYPFKEEYEVVSLDVVSVNFEDGEVVSLESLKDKGLVKGPTPSAKVLANGELTKKSYSRRIEDFRFRGREDQGRRVVKIR
jgi:large subunit ribosomal protein L15